MKIVHLVRVAALAGAVVFAASVASAHPTFSPESMSDFSAAFAAFKSAHIGRVRTEPLAARHADASRYHAYRFIIPDTVMIGVAQSVTLDSAGHVHIVQESGAPMSGRPNPTHREYSHILVPISVMPPR